jgi:hypothetical protein
MDIGKLKTDPSKETEGVWVELDGTASIKVRYSDSIESQKKVNDRLRPYRKLVARDSEAIPQEEQDRLAKGILADYILVDWKGITENGAEVAFSRENARRLLEIPIFRQMVERAAQDIANFRAAQAEEDAKNSVPVSAGT